MKIYFEQNILEQKKEILLLKAESTSGQQYIHYLLINLVGTIIT